MRHSAVKDRISSIYLLTACAPSHLTSSLTTTTTLLLLLHPFNGLLSKTTRVSRHQKGRISLDLNEAKDDGDLGWQWHQLDHVQTICTSLQTDNRTNSSSLNFHRPDALAQPCQSTEGTVINTPHHTSTTSCCSTDSERPHRCCHLANNWFCYLFFLSQQQQQQTLYCILAASKGWIKQTYRKIMHTQNHITGNDSVRIE